MNNKQIELENDVVLEIQDDSATPLARFEEYIRFSEKLEQEDIDSVKAD